MALSGKTEQAAKMYIQADNAEPGSTQGHCRAGDLYLRSSRPKDAFRVFSQAAERDRNSKCVMLGLARAHIELDNTKFAYDAIHALKTKHPEDPKVVYLEGLCLYRQDRTDEALVLFQRAVGMDSGFGEAHLKIGDVFFSRGMYQEALQAYSLAARAAQHEVQALIQIGRIYILQQQPKRGLVALRKAVAMDRSNAWGQLYLGEALMHDQQIDKAISAFQQALHLNPKMGQAHVRLGQIYEGNMFSERAYRSFSQAVRVDPECFEGYLNLARLQLDRNQKNLARRSLRYALKLRPDCVACRIYLARLQIEARQYKRAVSLLEDILRVDYQNHQAHFLLGKAYLGLGDIERATLEYNALALANEEELANTLYELIQRKNRKP